MGIGLSLCRSIVESHRGRIKAQNLYNGTPVTGCRFAFTLPVDTTARHEETTLAHPPDDTAHVATQADHPADQPAAARTPP